MEERLQHRPGPGRARVLVDGLDHPEGVAYDPATGVVWAGGEAGQIYRVDLERETFEEAARLPGEVLGVAVDGRGRVVACCPGDRSLSALDGTTVHRVLTEADGRPLAFPNYPAFVEDGTLFVSDSGTWGANDGRIVRLDADGGAATFSTALGRFANGLAVSPDGRWLWAIESFDPTVSRFDLRSGDGRPELIVRLHGCVPDGLAFTADGGVLITCYRPDAIYHLGADGRLELVANDPQGTLLAGATNACFAGRRLDRVVSANLNRRHLTLLDLGLTGAPLPRPERWALDALATGR